ncbi:Spt2 chromatin protein [Thalictrum thalictroides]|uniref:Spt2 chromatin protein n=1 Tax=Thalictrum thalictroides TaxID=46969 RepID=A0A7J6VRB2_THATH|nr:Spt2 chromatin protein [Thalictrum thalictroides]
MREENTASFGVVGCQNIDKELPHDDFGTFFGPCQPAISRRVLQECKSLLPEIHNEKKVEVVHDMDSKTKVKKLKDNRDYSCLLSADSELPALKKENLHESTKPVSDDCKPNARQPNVPSAESRKQFGNNTGNQIRQHMGQKRLVSKVSDSSKKAVLGMKKAPLPSVSSSVQKQLSEQKKVIREPEEAKLNSKMSVDMKKAILSKQHSDHCQKREIGEPEKAKLNSFKMPAASSKPQSKPSKKEQTHVPMRPKKRSGVEDVSVLIRGMFGYDPTKYAGLDEDDSNMETNFADLSKEEKRSERLAREEDKRQLLLIEEEARQEKMKKEAKRRKLSKSE